MTGYSIYYCGICLYAMQPFCCDVYDAYLLLRYFLLHAYSMLMFVACDI